MKVTDRFAGPLARRLKGIDVEDLIENAFDLAVEDTREFLRMELEAEGASEELIRAVQLIPEERDLHATVGVPGDHPAAQEAIDFEYGDFDHTVQPHGVFRMVQGDMAATASAELAGQIEGRIRD